MKDSHIEWTTNTFNPWEGCTKVSPGCLNCYAETRNARFGGGTATNWGNGAPRRRTSASNWSQPLKWDREAAHDAAQALILGHEYTRPRVFCASLADWLDDEVPVQWLADLLALIQATPHLDWLLLTKRPQNWQKRLDCACHDADHEANGEKFLNIPGAWIASWLGGFAPHNVWIGTSVEDQTRADERIPTLLSIPAKIRFLSMEPLLGPVDLKLGHNGVALHRLIRDDLHWIIVGGESGPNSRPMNPNWARHLRDQCAVANTPFFFKQWGGVNKKEAGRILDGETYSEFPIAE